MVDWSKKFKSEYDAVKAEIAKTEKFDRDWQPLIRKLQTLMGAEGFDPGQEVALGELRRKVTEGKSQTKLTEDQGILAAVGEGSNNDTAAVTSASKKLAASLKLLRHIYLQNKSGNRRVWVVNLPTEFTDWPTPYMAANASTRGQARQLLASNREHFTDQQRRYLGNSTQQALAWCQKAGMVLANAAKPGPDRDNARGIVKRWFAESGLADAALDGYIARLSQGFKDIVAMLNKGHFIVTDWVPFRGTTDADESGFLASEAFTFRSNHEGMDVVYIESAFFTDDPGGVVHGQANWTRIVVHELTHLVCGTEDVSNGQTRYAWYGIGPHAGYPGAECVRNADNWAFFAADCGGALTDSERAKALRIR